MGIGWSGPAHQNLQQSLHIRYWLEVLAACHQCDTLQGIVVRDAEMIARGRVLAREHHIAEVLRVTENGVLAGFHEGQGSRYA